MDLSKIKLRIRNKTPKRLGRGTGSGWGKTSGRGHKGAGSRSGKKLPYVGFNGGNIPYIRKLPKRGFTSLCGNDYQIVNLRDIEKKINAAGEITPKILKAAHLIRNEEQPVKILASIDEKFSLKATFKADSFSAKAKQIIEGAGGKIELLKRSGGEELRIKQTHKNV
jgi:large subunit ribosomal protein L15